MLKYALLLILSLWISLSVSATDKGVLPIKEKPLPVKNITVKDLLKFSDNISDELLKVSDKVEEEKAAKASEPTVGMNGFQFAENRCRIGSYPNHSTTQYGTLIYTGTPVGVGQVKIGDKLEDFLGDESVLNCEIR